MERSIDQVIKEDREEYHRWRKSNPEVRLDLTHLDFSKCNLSGLDFTEADFTGTDLTGADLREASMFTTNLKGVNLSGSDLSKALFNGANMNWADLTGCNLTGTDFTGAELQYAKLIKVKAVRAKFLAARLNNANLSGGDFTNASFQAARLNFVTLDNADLSGADLSQAELEGTSLESAQTHNAKLKEISYTSSPDLAPEELMQTIAAAVPQVRKTFYLSTFLRYLAYFFFGLLFLFLLVDVGVNNSRAINTVRANSVIQKADASMHRGQAANAEKLYCQALKLKPDMVELHLRLAQVLSAQKQNQAAVEEALLYLEKEKQPKEKRFLDELISGYGTPEQKEQWQEMSR